MERLTLKLKKPINNGFKYIGVNGANAQKILSNLGKFEDIEEQGLFLNKEDAVDEGYLYDWYIHSVGEEDPVWTEQHISEMYNDFYILPRDVVDKLD